MTTSAFLYYMAMQEASSGAMLALNDRYRPEMLVFLPQQEQSENRIQYAIHKGLADYHPSDPAKG